jgi:hypothetical protein
MAIYASGEEAMPERGREKGERANFRPFLCGVVVVVLLLLLRAKKRTVFLSSLSSPSLLSLLSSPSLLLSFSPPNPHSHSRSPVSCWKIGMNTAIVASAAYALVNSLPNPPAPASSALSAAATISAISPLASSSAPSSSPPLERHSTFSASSGKPRACKETGVSGSTAAAASRRTAGMPAPASDSRHPNGKRRTARFTICATRMPIVVASWKRMLRAPRTCGGAISER